MQSIRKSWQLTELRALFYSLLGMVVFFAMVVAVAYFLPDCGPC